MFRLKILLAIALALAFGASSASADFSFNLSNGNSFVSPFPAPYASVNVHLNSSTQATITFTGLTSGGYTYLLIDTGIVGVNIGNTSNGWTVSNITWTSASTVYPSGGFSAQTSITDDGAKNEDGFGSFNQTFKAFDAVDHAVTQVVFTVTGGAGTNWTNANQVLVANSGGSLAAAHIAVFESNKVVNNYQSTTGFSAGDGTSPVVPVPPSAVLLGIGGLGFLGFLRRNRRGQSVAA